MKIGIFDSGYGGITILAATKKLLPREKYFYIADSKNCPYGEKSDEELYHIVTQNVEKLKEWGAKIIIIACNTATVKCIAQLRKDYPEIRFVGTEPAINLAARRRSTKNILVLATPGTVHSERTLKLEKSAKLPGQNIQLLACPGLADAIEQSINIVNHDRVETAKVDERSYPMLSQLLDQLLPDDCTAYDAVVLGCTHYPLILPLFKQKFPHATIVDGSRGVARQVARLCR